MPTRKAPRSPAAKPSVRAPHVQTAAADVAPTSGCQTCLRETETAAVFYPDFYAIPLLEFADRVTQG